MYAAVRREHIKKFERCLIEGIGFVFKTTVSPCDTVSDALFLSLAKFDVILSGSANSNILHNVMGQVVDRSKIQDLNANNKPTKKIDFHLRDQHDTRLACTLWGKYAEIVDQACQESADGTVVCLIRFAKINLYNDTKSVSNSFDVSQVFVDPTLAELGLFKQSIPTDGLTLGSSGSFHKRLYAPRTGDDDGDYPRQTIKDVLTSSDVGKCKTVCTVSAIDTDWPWYYFCCRAHNKKVVEEEAIKLEDVKLPQKPRFWCEICNGFAKYVVAKFWLHLHIMGQTGEARCMLFDSHAKEIFGTIAPELLDGSFDEIEDPTVLPDVINGLKGKTFQFLFCIQRENIFGGYDSFTVARVYTGNIVDEIVQEDSDAYVDPSSLISIEQSSLMLTNGVDLFDVDLSSTSTPSSKRKDSDDVDGNDQASTSRKKCSRMTMSEEGSGE
ncbi:AT4g07450 [Arabidopsis thaliana]|uniref:AT4g07450 protein n=1 Tax=Arabidopsis thaliana TaxID=3702 RepID=Q9S9X0_ARATH|nr:contains similarity to Oryza sativa replication protein A1 (GB:AF009179) [Arabidopsis thaliana]CAB81115.1 AT4g07450 [Arabidopsis thaliana]